MAEEHIVIIGAGIIGVSTAYYLSRPDSTVRPCTIHLVENADEFFASASGKAGGFLASDWFGSEVADLGALSFRLHRDLAAEHGGREKWGYSTSTGTSYVEAKRRHARDGKNWLLEGVSRAEAAGVHRFGTGQGPAWLARKDGDQIEVIGEQESVAQVDPLRLSQWLLAECRGRGVNVHQPAEVVRVDADAGRVTAAHVRWSDGTTKALPCTRLLIASGAWSGRVYEKLFPDSGVRIPISSLAGHSIVLKSPRWTSEHAELGCHAVFSSARDGIAPEYFSRVNGEIYLAGLNDAALALPARATDAVIDQSSIGKLKGIADRMLGPGTDVNDLEVVREGLCFRPITANGRPILGPIPSKGKTETDAVKGLFVAAGHGPWGISMSLGTGLVMAEMLVGRKTSIDVSGLALS